MAYSCRNDLGTISVPSRYWYMYREVLAKLLRIRRNQFFNVYNVSRITCSGLELLGWPTAVGTISVLSRYHLGTSAERVLTKLPGEIGNRFSSIIHCITDNGLWFRTSEVPQELIGMS